jgi:hypothetical protein
VRTNWWGGITAGTIELGEIATFSEYIIVNDPQMTLSARKLWIFRESQMCLGPNPPPKSLRIELMLSEIDPKTGQGLSAKLRKPDPNDPIGLSEDLDRTNPPLHC